MSTTTYYTVTPRYVARRSSVAAALKVARGAERAAQASHGPQAGADCYIVRETLAGLEFRGMAADRAIIGRNLGCGPGVVAQVRAAITEGRVRTA